MKTAVVILNWNTREYLEKWLPGLISSCGDAEVIVADSASDDGSREMLFEKFPEVRMIALDDNYGFTGGYNRALAQIDAEYYVLINSDIKVRNGWLEPLVEWMDSHGDCGVCGPKLHKLLKDGKESEEFEYAGAAGGRIDRYGYPFCRGRVMKRTEKDSGQYDSPRNVMWISGACMMTRSSLWKTLGGFDDRFFAHMEEIDYCWRAQLGGYSVTVVPQSTVYHLGGGTLPQSSPFKLKLNFRNNLLLLSKNLPVTIGKEKASRRILFRKALDWCSALVYLFTGKPGRFKAVRDAHREYSELSKDAPAVNVAFGASVYGYHDICIIPLSLIFGKNIFKYLKNYENRH